MTVALLSHAQDAAVELLFGGVDAREGGYLNRPNSYWAARSGDTKALDAMLRQATPDPDPLFVLHAFYGAVDECDERILGHLVKEWEETLKVVKAYGIGMASFASGAGCVSVLELLMCRVTDLWTSMPRRLRV